MAEKNLKFKLSVESQQKIKNLETKEIQHSKSSEASGIDTYENVVAPKVSRLNPDLFSGLMVTSAIVTQVNFRIQRPS